MLDFKWPTIYHCILHDVVVCLFAYVLRCLYYILGKLHFITLNYALDYTLHPKLFKRTLCTLNYHTYYTLHHGIIFAVIFNEILLHMTNTCFLLRRNKLKKPKYPSSKSIKTKHNFFHISLSRMHTHCPDPNLDSCADERHNDIVGSVYYVAPEVLHTSYSLEARRYMEHWSYNLHFITWKLGFRVVLRAKS